MKTIRLFRLELRRLLQSRLTWLAAGLTALSPALGLSLYKTADASTMLSMYLANPAIAGGAAGGILFGLLTIFELDRASAAAWMCFGRGGFPALHGAPAPDGFVCRGFFYPGTYDAALAACQLAADRRGIWRADYLLAYLLLMGLALPLGILSSAAAYQFTRRADLSLILFAAFAALSPYRVGG